MPRKTFRLPSRLRRLAGRTCAFVIAAAAPAAAQEPEYELAPIIVRSKLDYSGAVDGYLAPASETGVKAGVPLSEVPQSITVVTSTELEARQPAQIEDAIKYSAGINASTWGTDDRFDQYAVRGFDLGASALYRDGLPQKVLSFSAFTSDPYMLDRVDVLRGPAGVLYGSNDAGGMVNLVTKRPVFGRLAEGRVSYGSHGTGTLAFDFSNVLNESGTVAGRLTGLLRDGATEIDNSANNRALLAGGLTWAPSDRTSITFLGHVQRDALTPINFAPVADEDYDTSWGTLPGDWPYRMSDYNHFRTRQYSFGWEATHEFSDALTFTQRLRYAHQDTDYAQLDYSYADASGVNYYAFRNDEEAETLGLDNSLEWKSPLAGGENSLIVGADYQLGRHDVTQYYDGTIYTIPYATASFDFAVADPALSSRSLTTYRETGLYLQDHVKFDMGTSVTAGLRHSWFETDIEDLLGSSTESQDDQATIGMLGVTHEFANGLTPYLGYSEGFLQNYGQTIAGDPLDPSKSHQWELGLRYAPPSGGLLLSAALFDLRKTNVKDYDLDDPTFSSFTQVGEVRSRGLELEARGRFSATLEGVASYTYLDTEITRSSDPSKLGNENAMAPRHQAAFWLDYDASSLALGLTAGAGLRLISDAYATQDNLRTTRGYALADLSLHYEADTYAVDLGVTNLFDRDYFGVCYDGYGCARGEGRKVTLSLNRAF